MNVNDNIAQLIKNELEQLNQFDMIVDGKAVNPGSCYYFGSSPLHVLYNTNCPDTLKNDIQKIINKYIPDVEDSIYKQAGG